MTNDWTTLVTDTSDADEDMHYQARRTSEGIQTRWAFGSKGEQPGEAGQPPHQLDEAEAIALRDWLNKKYPLVPQDGRPDWTYLGGDREHPSLAEIRQSPEYRALKDNFGRMFGCRSMWHLKSKPLKKVRQQQMTWPQLFEEIILTVLCLNQAREAGDTNLADNQEQLLEGATGEFLRRIYLLLGLKETPPQAKSQPTNQ